MAKQTCTCGSCGCSSADHPPESLPDNTILIEWQRLVEDNKTCPRCGDTGSEIDKAEALLNRVFEPLDCLVKVRKKELSMETFQKNPASSNHILIDGKLLELWLGADTGMSPCCDVCGDAECRTIDLNGTEFETIPARLIILACLEAYIQKEKLKC